MNIIESNLRFGVLSDIGTVTKITYHHADSKKCTVEDIHQWHLNNGWSGCGYHYFIKKDGKIYRGRPENKKGAHVANSNSGNIGICFEGRFTVENISDAQVKSGKEITAYLKKKYGLSDKNLYGHSNFMATDCPGFDISIFKGNNVAIGSGGTTISSWKQKVEQEHDRQGLKYYTILKYKTPRISGGITKLVQEKLISLGISLGKWGTDGDFGKVTDSAVREFQKRYGLYIDGIVGPNTWAKLFIL